MKKHILFAGFISVLCIGLKAQVNFQFRGTELNCQGGCNGSCWVVPTGNYQYRWSTGATTDSIGGLCEGNYWGLVADSANNTLDSIGFSIIPLGPQIYFVDTEPACNHFNSGVITARAYPGALGEDPPYSFNWSNGSTDSTITGVTAGTYSVTVTDVMGCTGTASYMLNMQSPDYQFYLYASDSLTSCNATNGAATASATGPHPPFSYTWGTVPPQYTPTATGLGVGTYTVTVTDAIGCIANGSVEIGASCQNYITGTLFYDNNGNCIKDSADAPVRVGFITANGGGSTYYAMPDSLGNYVIEVPGNGPYVLQIINGINGQCLSITPCDSTITITFDSLNSTSANNNFGFVPSSGFDLTLHPGWSAANPGFEKDYWILYYNLSGTPFTGTAQIFFQYDPNLVFLSSDIPYTTYNASTYTLSWDVNNFSQGWNGIGEVRFTVPTTLSLNYQLQSRFWILPTAGDCDTSNNYFSFSEPVTGSHDPNEKTVSPSGQLTDADSVLTYTINFQNTGTDTAWFITVVDTLPPGLDPASVVNLASSIKYSSFKISGTGILTWVFNPAYLPDSSVNQPGSKGFVMFSVHRKNNLAPGVSIANRAAIYFDYNPPVFTNTVTDTIAQPSGIATMPASANIQVKAYPNPFSDITNIEITGINTKYNFELYDVTGRLQLSIPSGSANHFQIARGNLAAGVYLYHLATGNNESAAYGKLVVE